MLLVQLGLDVSHKVTEDVRAERPEQGLSNEVVELERQLMSECKVNMEDGQAGILSLTFSHSGC